MPGTGALTTFPTSLAVKKGDVIGLASTTGSLHCSYNTGAQAQDQVGYGYGGPLGGTYSFAIDANTERLNLSATFQPDCVVPQLKGKTVPAAQHALAMAHCALGQVTKMTSSGPAGIVLSQRPQPGKDLPQGAKVAVVVSKK